MAKTGVFEFANQFVEFVKICGIRVYRVYDVILQCNGRLSAAGYD
jgi:hypothetical protein